MAGKWAWVLAFCFVASAFPSPAAADHEVFYRYVVLGYVKDAKGIPHSGAEIKLVREKTGLAYYAETEADGFYMIVVRLADEDLGNRLRVTASGASATISARFDPKNRKDERGTRVDFLGKKVVERPTWFASSLKRFLAR